MQGLTSHRLIPLSGKVQLGVRNKVGVGRHFKALGFVVTAQNDNNWRTKVFLARYKEQLL